MDRPFKQSSRTVPSAWIELYQYWWSALRAQSMCDLCALPNSRREGENRRAPAQFPDKSHSLTGPEGVQYAWLKSKWITALPSERERTSSPSQQVQREEL